jgi:MGT family glycosyltransferase
MARAVILAYPTHGHIAPILPVAAELVRRGEDVVFYGTGRSRAKIEGTGAQFRQYARGHDDFNPTPPTEGLFSDMARLAALTEDILPGLLDEVRGFGPAYLLFDTKSLWGRLAGSILAIPAVTLSVVFAIREGVIGVPELTGLLYGGAPAGKLLSGLLGLGEYFEAARRLRRKYGAAAPGIVGYLGNPQPLNIIFTSRELQLGSEAFGGEFVFVGPSIPPARDAATDFPFERLDGRPLVYVSLGTTFHNAPEFYRASFEALGGGPWQVVLSTGGAPPALGAVPENFLVRRFVPQLALLERANAFVTHGGMNSANEALYFGVPLVVVPQRGDQYMVGARVAQLGAGVAIAPQDLNPERLRLGVASVLEKPSFRERAQALGASLRAAGGYCRAADAIQSFARSRELCMESKERCTE